MPWFTRRGFAGAGAGAGVIAVADVDEAHFFALCLGLVLRTKRSVRTGRSAQRDGHQPPAGQHSAGSPAYRRRPAASVVTARPPALRSFCQNHARGLRPDTNADELCA